MEIEVELPRGFRHFLYVLAAFALILALSLLGLAVSPRDASGDPIVLSPANLAILRYLRQSSTWIQDLQGVDGEIAALLEGNGDDIYREGKKAQGAFRKALDVTRAVERTSAPPALVSLQESLGRTSDAYLEAARAVLIYVSSPGEEERRQAYRALAAARAELRNLARQQERLWPMKK